MPDRLLLLRHGQSTWNADGRWQGWSDPPLSDLGREQAAEAGARLAGRQGATATARPRGDAGGDLGITGVASSDLGRARQTADILAAALGLAGVVVDPGLREYDVGDWEGLTRAEIEAGWPEHLRAWREGRLLATPGGETRSAFLARVGAAMRRLAATPGLGPAALVVTHGGVIRAAEQVSGTTRSEVIENVAGRWFTVDAGGRLRPGQPTGPLDADRSTSSPSP